MRTFQANVTHRAQSHVDEVLMAALTAWARKPAQEDIRLFQSMGVLPSTYDSLTRVKLVQIMAVLNRVYGQVGDKSWGCDASPNPVLPTDIEAKIIEKYALEGAKLAKLSGATKPEEIAQYVAVALEANETQIDRDRLAVSKERAERMERAVDDTLQEGDFTVSIVRKFIANLVKFGTAIIIGPCEEPLVQLTLRGKGDTVVYKPEIKAVLLTSVPATTDVYPSPGATEANDADLTIRVRYAKEALARAAEAGRTAARGWRPAVIRAVLKDFDGVDIGTQTLTDDTEKSANLAELPGTTKKFEGVRWFGLARGDELKALGIATDGIADINPTSYYETDAIVIANRVVYARVCDPAVGRHVVKTTFYGDSTQFFGWPPALQIDNCQKLMNIAMAALKKQLQLGGLVPLVVNDYSSFVDADRPGAFALTPGKVFLRNTNAFNQAQGAAVQPLQLPNLIREIIALFDAIAKLADDASGFNRNMLGSGNFSGAARTATGLMQIQEAASIIATFVIGNIDATAFVPLLKKIIAWLNRNHPDKRIKGDPQIVARGQLAKVMKSAQQQVITAGFQTLQGGVMPQLLGPEKMLTALREYLKSIDFPNADKIIPDEARVEFLSTISDAERALQMFAAAQGGQQQGGAGQQGSQQGGAGGQQPQPQQAQKEAGLGMPSGVEARRGAA